MFQIKRGCEIGDIGNNETAFEKTINFFKNDVGCAEISRTGQASDKSLTVELKYRDFPNFSLKMSTYNRKADLVFLGENPINSLEFMSTSFNFCDIILSEKYLFIICDRYLFGLIKDNLGTYYAFTDGDDLCSSTAGAASYSKDLLLLTAFFSANSKILSMDVFCPDFSENTSNSTIDFGRKLVGVKSITGLNGLSILSRFSVDGQEYVRLTSRLCVEVTS